MRNARHNLLFAFILILFAVFLLWPIGRVLRVAFFGLPESTDGFTLLYIKAIFLDSELRGGLINASLIAILVTFTCTAISVPLAILSSRYNFRGKAMMSGLLLVPLILPPFVGAIGMRQFIGRYGALTGLAQVLHIIGPDTPIDWFGSAKLLGIVLIESLSLYPIIFLNISAALANIDPAMEQAAANLGASRWTIFRKITLPLMRPGLFAGGTIVLIWSFTELGTPLMFEFNRVTSVQIFRRITQVSGSPMPYALVVMMLVISTLLYVIGKSVLGRRQDSAVTKASIQTTARELRGAKAFFVLLPFVIVTTLALLPHVGVLLTSVSGIGAWYQSVVPTVFTAEHYKHALTHDLTVPSVGNSIILAGCSMLVDLALGLVIAYLLVRSRIKGKGLLDSLAMLPLAVPGLVLAFGYLSISLQLQTWFKASPRISNLVDVTENPMLLLIVAYAIRRLPYVVRSAVAGLEQTPVDLELAAKNLGASSSLTLRKITIPLIAANLIAGGLLAFAFAMLEVSDSLVLAQKQDWWPITKAIYELFQRLGDGPYIASALGVWAMVLLTLTILSANSLLGRKMGAVFRV
jgi:iron(III) transport system permease protein